MNNYFELHKGLMNKYTKEKDSLIEVKSKDIKYLLELNKKKQIVIDKAVYLIDSLQKEKNKIKIVYKDRKDKIKELNSVELEKYWKDEIK
jgi:predicted AAA+ superfamily ATPase